jgi:hypothetical protein
VRREKQLIDGGGKPATRRWPEGREHPCPDEGKISLMEVVASPQQKVPWLKPLVEGCAHSCFAMTEPASRVRPWPSSWRRWGTAAHAAKFGRQWIELMQMNARRSLRLHQ